MDGAIEHLKDEAQPNLMDDDWIAHFFDKARLCGDHEMQSLWGKLLAGEGNSPGSYSKRTIDLIAGLDKHDAELFTKFTTYVCYIGKVPIPLIYELEYEKDRAYALTYSDFIHLEDIGFIKIDNVKGFNSVTKVSDFSVSYFGEYFDVILPDSERVKDGYRFYRGHVLLTAVGGQLAPIAGAKKSDEFEAYLLEEWREFGYRVVPK